MKNSFIHIKKKFVSNYLPSILALIIPLTSSGQTHPLPVLPDTSKLGQYTSRTMYLLHESTAEKKNDVRIVFAYLDFAHYGRTAAAGGVPGWVAGAG